MLGKLKKSFNGREAELWKVLYIRMFGLEFAVQAWSPHYQKDIDKLEQIQRRATKTITEIKHKPYAERLRFLGLTTLERRR